MARSMLSFGMLFAFASAMAARSRGLPLGSPPRMGAASLISLRMRVKILPRFASGEPFLCLMVLHLLWLDMRGCSFCVREGTSSLPRKFPWKSGPVLYANCYNREPLGADWPIPAAPSSDRGWRGPRGPPGLAHRHRSLARDRRPRLLRSARPDPLRLDHL